MAFGIDDAISAGLRILDKFIPDPAEKVKAEAELRAALMAWDQGQIEVNKVEAASTDKFVSRWRPFFGWVCGVAFAYHFIAQPVLLFLLALAGVKPPALPQFDMVTMMNVVMGLLGLAGLRTYEKTRNGK